MSRILLVEDDHAFALALANEIEAFGHDVDTAPSAELALETLAGARPDLVFLDARLPGRSGLDALPDMLARAPGLPVVLMSSHGSAETAIDAIARGAFDHVEKPIERDRLEKLLRRARPAPAATAPREPEPPRLIGASPLMIELGKAIGLAARSDATVLVRGESGAGKELVARAIHERGPRARRPFVALSCAAVPETLLEDELFGHARGAFTNAMRDRRGRIERAEGGTLFLDEIGELSPRGQAKLLRFLEDRVVEPLGGESGRAADVRIVAATNAPLEQRVAEGLFREDLFYRLAVVTIRVPSLRERTSDLPALVAHLLARGEGPRRATPAALEALASHRWPGNVRELKNVVEAAALAAAGLDAIEPQHLPPVLRARAGDAPSLEQAAALAVDARAGSPRVFDHIVDAVERAAVARALETSRGNQVVASRLLGMNRATFRAKMKRHGLGPDTSDPTATSSAHGRGEDEANDDLDVT